MKVGLLFALRNPEDWRTPWADHLAESIDLAIEAEDLGYDSVWYSEHHGSRDGYCSAPLTVSAAVAARTSRITVGTNILVLPLHHPVRVAEDVATIDLISRGRFVLGVGAGHNPSEFDTFGIDRTRRGRLLESGIARLREAWAADGEGRVFPPPTTAGGPPIWIGARAEAPTRRAGRIGDGIVLSRGRRQLEWFREGAVEAGRDPDSLAVATIRIVHVAESREHALREVAPHLIYHENQYKRWFSEGGDLAHETEATLYRGASDLPADRYVFGTPDDVLEQIRRLEQDYGFDHFVFWGRLPGQPLESTRRSLRLFADHVLPDLQKQCTAEED